MDEGAAEETPTVLVVDDEREVADAYALALRERYDVAVAYGGEDALSTVDEGIDVVLLDRRMPSVSGDEVLARIRERDLSCRVVMLTAIDPEFDIIGMPFDDYLCKPVTDEDLFGAIEQQLRIAAYERLGEYFRLASKREVLAAQVPRAELDANEEYADLTAELERLRTDIAAAVEEFDDLLDRFEEVDRTATG